MHLAVWLKEKEMQTRNKCKQGKTVRGSSGVEGDRDPMLVITNSHRRPPDWCRRARRDDVFRLSFHLVILQCINPIYINQRCSDTNLQGGQVAQPIDDFGVVIFTDKTGTPLRAHFRTNTSHKHTADTAQQIGNACKDAVLS